MIADLAFLLLACALALLGGVLLALSQSRNWRVVTGDRNAPPKARSMRRLGWLLALGALAPCVMRDGWSFAALLWPLVLGVAALLVAMTLSFCPHWMKPVAGALSGKGVR